MGNSKLAVPRLAGALALAALLCVPGGAAAQAGVAVQAGVATQDRSEKPARLVLMPLKVADADRKLAPNLEAAFVEGLSQRYEVYAGERVIKAASAAKRHHPRASRHSRSTRNRREAVRSTHEIASAFRARLVARADAIRDGHDYLNIRRD